MVFAKGRFTVSASGTRGEGSDLRPGIEMCEQWSISVREYAPVYCHVSFYVEARTFWGAMRVALQRLKPLELENRAIEIREEN